MKNGDGQKACDVLRRMWRSTREGNILTCIERESDGKGDLSPVNNTPLVSMKTLFVLFTVFVALALGGFCPRAANYTDVPLVYLTFAVDDALPYDPTGGDNMRGFSEFFGFDDEHTQAYWRAGLNYIKWRFGIDGTACTWNAAGVCFLGPDPANPAFGWKVVPFGDPAMNIAISPITYTAANTYRVVLSTSPYVTPVEGRYPLVMLAEFIVTFLGPVNVSGTYGAETAAAGYVTFLPSPGQVGDGVAWGRYMFCAGARNYSFEMRSWWVSHRWQATQTFPYVERFQVGSHDLRRFPDGYGTIELVYPNGPVIDSTGKSVYPWYVRNDWRLGDTVAYPELSRWAVGCGSACDTKLINA